MPKAIKLFNVQTEGAVGLNLADLVGNDRITISRTPIGAKPGEEKYYIKRAVAWKGKRAGSINVGLGEFVKNAVSVGIPEGTAQALYQIAEDSRKIREMLGPEAYGLVAVKLWNGREEVLPIVAYVKLLKKLIVAGKYDLIREIQVRRIPTRKVRVSNRPGHGAYHVPIQSYAEFNLAEFKADLFNPQKLAMTIQGRAGKQELPAVPTL